MRNSLLAENHLAFFLLDLAPELDLEAIHGYYRQKDPRDEKACWEDPTVRVLTDNQKPDHKPQQRLPSSPSQCPGRPVRRGAAAMSEDRPGEPGQCGP